MRSRGGRAPITRRTPPLLTRSSSMRCAAIPQARHGGAGCWPSCASGKGPTLFSPLPLGDRKRHAMRLLRTEARLHLRRAAIRRARPRQIDLPMVYRRRSASAKFETTLVDGHPLTQDGIPDAIVEEVCRWTPRYVSRQQDTWIAHCGDACEFHGDAQPRDIETALPKTKRAWMNMHNQDETGWHWATNGYRPGAFPPFTSLYAAIARWFYSAGICADGACARWSICWDRTTAA